MRNETLWIYLDIFLEKRVGDALCEIMHVENVTPKCFPNMLSNMESIDRKIKWEWEDRTDKVYNHVSN